MALMRSMLLAASQNTWLRRHAAKFPFVRRSVSRFMPGETLEAALAAAQVSAAKENWHCLHSSRRKCRRPRRSHPGHRSLPGSPRPHPSSKIFPPKFPSSSPNWVSIFLPIFVLRICNASFEREKPTTTVWVDMEASNYVDATLDIYRRALQIHPNVGICLQAYLYRTKKDLADLLPMRPSIRLVKGAYKEPASIAFPKKADVDENYFALAQDMLRANLAGICARAAFGTHDVALIRRIGDFATEQGIAKSDFEVQMLYGIQRAEQERLAQDGCRSIVLVAYGTYWYPWFVRRLAERPANVWFLLRNVFAS